MDEDEFDDIFPDFTEMWDNIKNEWNRELFDPEDDDYRDEDETETEEEDE